MLAPCRLSRAAGLCSGKAVCHYFKNCYITGMSESAVKNVLITGAAKRIGRTLALSLAEAGWSVAVHYAGSAEYARSAAQEIAGLGQRAVTLQADLQSAEAVGALLPAAAEALGPITALINNASLFERDTAHTITPESWDAHLNINLRAPALLMRDFANQPHWQTPPAPDVDGAILNIIDQRVWRLTPDFASYTVSKTGLWTLTQSFAQALAPQHIRVNAIGPGPTLPNPRQAQSEFDKQAGLVPLGHGGDPADIAAAAHYLLSARAVTGQMIAVDGGQHLAWQTPDVTQVVE